MRGALDRYMPVSDDKISLEYKLKRWLEGCLLHPDEAHFFWNGTFSPEQLAQIRPGIERQRTARAGGRSWRSGRAAWWTAT